MASVSMRQWLNQMGCVGRHAGRQVHHIKPHCRPRLEPLEVRCLLTTVTNLDGAGPGSLRQAIADTEAGGTVDFEPGLTGTIIAPGLLIGKDLTIVGPGADVMTVNGNHAGEVFTISAAFTVQIAGLTIADGLNGGHGGGIQNFGILTVANCILRDNFSVRGGGIANFGMLTVIDSTLSNNEADLVGAGIYSLNPWVTTLIRSTVSGNSPDAIYNQGALNVLDSTVSGNGSGIGNDNLATITNSTISGNTVSGIANGGTMTITSSTISANGHGLVNSTLHVVHLRNTLIAGNTGPSSPDVSGTLDSQGHNLIGNGTGGSGYTDTDLVGTPDNPIDPLLGPLQDNGGPTLTHALLPGSPALNVGDSDELGNPDQRGVLRSGGVNIGAYQASASAFVLDAPKTVSAGVPFDLIVTAADIFAQTAVGYTGRVTFSTSDPDPDIVLPADYSFTAEDGGVHRFTDTGQGEISLLTPGDQTITVTDTMDNTIMGNVTVTVGSPDTRLSGLATRLQPLGPSTARTAAQTWHALSGREVAATDRLFASSQAKCSALFGRRLSHEGQGAVDLWRFV